VRKTRARAFGAASGGLTLAAALALSACSGSPLLSLGGALPADDMNRYLSPMGDDLNPGSQDSPWKTFKRALPELMPRMTLYLLPGTYERTATGTGTLNVRCVPDATTSSTVTDSVVAKDGLPGMGMDVTVRAYTGGLAELRGDGSVPPVSIDSCQNWSIQGLRVESQDVDDNQTLPDTGSVVVLDGANENVTIENLLALHPNRYKHAQVIRIGDGASDVTVKDSELYDFHESGIEARRSRQLVIERNYVNARDSEHTMDHVNPPDQLGDLGSIGVRLQETSSVHVQNNVVEDTSVGFAVVGRDKHVAADVLPGKIQFNILQGNIVYEPGTIGFRIDSQCNGVIPCDDAHTVTGTQLINDVVYRGLMGVSDAGSVGTLVNQLSIIDSARGVFISKEPQNNAISPMTTVTNTLVFGYQSVGFQAPTGQPNWIVSHCEAKGGYQTGTDFNPDDPAHVMDKVTTDPGLGMCIAYLPQSSMLRTGALNDVGANVIYEYDDTGQPTTTLLWKPSFVGCTNIVQGVNGKDDHTKHNCTNVNERLVAADPTLCPLPPPPP
jgi:hypothetical protein